MAAINQKWNKLHLTTREFSVIIGHVEKSCRNTLHKVYLSCKDLIFRNGGLVFDVAAKKNTDQLAGHAAYGG